MRKEWGFMKLPFFNKGMWEEFRERENKKRVPLAGKTIYGTDIHPKVFIWVVNMCFNMNKGCRGVYS